MNEIYNKLRTLKYSKIEINDNIIIDDAVRILAYFFKHGSYQRYKMAFLMVKNTIHPEKMNYFLKRLNLAKAKIKKVNMQSVDFSDNAFMLFLKSLKSNKKISIIRECIKNRKNKSRKKRKKFRKKSAGSKCSNNYVKIIYTPMGGKV